ncbi:MBL fold metallo-hydrolase [Cytophagaceae bacterium ABcell3]|nr:MBL fold metallo-hydrolase [Cytophagaceae bacterium ABcell3]
MDQVKLKVIGCGDAFSSGGRFTTSFFSQWNGKGFLLDCGSTILPAMKRAGVSSNDVDVIFISHLHGDHYGGLPYFLLDASIQSGREKGLTILGPTGIEEKTHELFKLLYPGSSYSFDINFIEYKTYEGYEVEGVGFKPYPVVHSEGTYPHGYRLTFGSKVLAYSGDTGWTDELIPLSEGADLFICECNFVELKMAAHINYKELEEHLNDFNVKRLLLTHMADEMIEYQVSGVEKAHDGLELVI